MDEYYQVVQTLPQWLARPLGQLPSEDAETVHELRLRRGCAPQFTVQGCGCTPTQLAPELNALQTMQLTPLQMEEILFTLCGGSVHTHQTEIAQGYVTLENGCRAGLGGRFLQNPEQGTVLQELTSVNLRIAREKTVPLPQELTAALRGHFIGMLLVGEPGSGKTTLLRILMGLEEPTSGIVQGIGQVAAVFQEDRLCPQLTAVQNVTLVLPGSAEQYKKQIIKDFQQFGMDAAALDLPAARLSGGQKRRVAIAGVMAMEPKVLILDEPTAGLDPRGRDEILAQIRAYHETKRATVILVSHSMEEIARNVGRIVVMRDAHVYMDGTPRQVFARAEELEQAGLDVPQVTKIAMALRRRGMDIDPAVYTIEELEQALLDRRGGGEKC